MEFCKQFNARTQDKMGKVLPVLIIRLFRQIISSSSSRLLPLPFSCLEAAKLQSGSKEPNRNKVGKVNWNQVEAIAKDKMPDLNCFTLESAMTHGGWYSPQHGLTVDGNAPGKINCSLSR